MHFGQHFATPRGPAGNLPALVCQRGVVVRQSRYVIEARAQTVENAHHDSGCYRHYGQNRQLVILKRLECSDGPLANRAGVAYYGSTAPLAQLRHPLIPRA